MTTLLLALAYTFGAALAHGVCFGLGALVWCVPAPERPADRLLAIFARHAVGLGVLSFIVVVLGLFRVLNAPAVALAVLPLAAAGWWRARTGVFGGLGSAWRRRWRGFDRLDRWGFALVTGVLALWALHVVVGGMAPDASQDALWYHLTVPGQWVLRGDVAMFTHVMPSTYTLAGEAHYAALLFFSDEMSCSVFYSQTMLWAWAAMAAVVWRFSGPRAALFTAASVLLIYARTHVRAPIWAGHDVTALYLLMIGATMLWAPLADETMPCARVSGMAGVLLASAVATKIIVAMFVLALGLGMAGYILRRPDWRKKFAVVLGVFVVLGTLVYAPWIVRGVVCSSDQKPLSVLALIPGYDAALTGYNNSSRFYPLTVEGIRQALVRGIPLRIQYAISAGDSILFLIPLVCFVVLVMRRGWWRAAASVPLICYGLSFWMQGFNEVQRFFSISYVLALPVLGETLGMLAGALSARLRGLLLILLMIASTAQYAQRQFVWGNYSTIQWPYRPILTARDRSEWIAHTEHGDNYLMFGRLQSSIPSDALILLPDCVYPYYLKRRCVWGDEASEPILDDLWAGLDARGAYEQMKSAEITHVLAIHSDYPDPRITEMVDSGHLVLVRTEQSDKMNVAIWRVV